MIIIQTKLKVVPEKCNKCKYSYQRLEGRFCAVSTIGQLNRLCPMEYNKEKRNWEYVKPDWCPLKEIEPVGSGKYFINRGKQDD